MSRSTAGHTPRARNSPSLTPRDTTVLPGSTGLRDARAREARGGRATPQPPHPPSVLSPSPSPPPSAAVERAAAASAREMIPQGSGGASDEEELVVRYRPLGSGRVRGSAVKSKNSSEDTLSTRVAMTSRPGYRPDSQSCTLPKSLPGSAGAAPFTTPRLASHTAVTFAPPSPSAGCHTPAPPPPPTATPTPPPPGSPQRGASLRPGAPRPAPSPEMFAKRRRDAEKRPASPPGDRGGGGGGATGSPRAGGKRGQGGRGAGGGGGKALEGDPGRRLYSCAEDQHRRMPRRRKQPVGLVAQKPVDADVKPKADGDDDQGGDAVSAHGAIKVLSAVAKLKGMRLRRDNRPRGKFSPRHKNIRCTPRKLATNVLHRKRDDYVLSTPAPRGSRGWLEELRAVCLRLNPIVSVPPFDEPGCVFSFVSSIKTGFEHFAYALPCGFDEYTLRVCSREQIGDRTRFFLLSSKGVTYRDCLAPYNCDFTGLKEWCAEFERFKLVQTLPLFQNYRKWRVFRHWRGSVLRAKRDERMELLSHNHLAFNREWSPSLLSIKRLCEDISMLSFFKLLPEPCSLGFFAAQQTQQMNQCKAELMAKVAQIREIATQACISAAQQIHESDHVGLVGTSFHPGLLPAHVRAGAVEIAEKYRRASLGRTTRSFILLADYLLKRAIVELTLSSYRGIEVLIQDPGRARDSEVIINMMIATKMMTKKEALAAKKVVAKETANVMLGIPTKTVTNSAVKCNAVELAAQFARNSRTTTKRVPMRRAAGATPFAMKVASGGRTSCKYIPIFQIEVSLDKDSGDLYVNTSRGDFVDTITGLLEQVEGIVAVVSPLTTLEVFRSLASGGAMEDVPLDLSDFDAEPTTDLLSPVMDTKAFPGRRSAPRSTTPLVNDDEKVSGRDEHGRLTTLFLLRSSEDYQSILVGINNTIEVNTEKVQECTHTFQHFADISTFNTNLDLAEVRASGATLTDYKDLLAKFAQQTEEVEHIPATCEVGAHILMLGRVRDIIMPAPALGRKKVSELLPVLVRELNAAVLGEIECGVKSLTKPVTELDDLADFIESHSSLIKQIGAIQSRFQETKTYVDLIEAEQIDTSPDDLKTWNRVTIPAMENLLSCLATADHVRDSYTQEFSTVLESLLTDLVSQFEALKEKSDDSIVLSFDVEPPVRVEYLRNLLDACTEGRKEERRLNRFQELFGLEVTRLPIASALYKDVSEKYKLWCALSEWLAYRETWMGTPYRDLSSEDMQSLIQQYTKVVNNATRIFDFNHVVLRLRVLVDECKLCIPVMVHLTNKSLRQRHYDQLEELMHSTRLANADCTLSELVSLGAVKRKDEIADISLTATHEADLESQFFALEASWADVEFSMYEHKASHRDTLLLHEVEGILSLSDDAHISLCMICSSRFCSESLHQKASDWMGHLQKVHDFTARWLECQEHWLYLDKVFGIIDVARLWPKETHLFGLVDKEFRERIKRLSQSPYVIRSVVRSDVFSGLDVLLRSFEKVLHSLSRSLDERRRIFPRYYFLTDGDLLDLISRASVPNDCVRHLPKLFENVHFITVSDGAIEAVASMEGETLKLSKLIRAKKDADKWIEKLEETIWMTLRKEARTCLYEKASKSHKIWLLTPYPSQLLVAVHGITFVSEVEKSLVGNGTIRNLSERLTEDLELYGRFSHDNLPKPQRRCMATLVTTTIHHRDIVACLLEANTSSVDDFDWKRTLRTYWSEAGSEITVSHVNHDYTYGYEFTGALNRLVSTCVTERVMMSISTAMSNLMGSAAAGPAGTGKTEIIRDFARGVARLCIVYNCSAELTYRTSANFFSGLCHAGAWVCLDEFNRVTPAVLSVVAQQLYDARTALLTGAGMVTIEERSVIIKPTFAAFATMNLSYVGRSELPENVKAYFRPVAVMHTDALTVIRVTLFVADFKHAEALAPKVHLMYTMSDQLFSRAHHYDFGMRALKAALLAAGEAHARLSRGSVNSPYSAEESLVVSSCWDSIYPRLCEEDIEVFRGIVVDLFPGFASSLPMPELQKLVRRTVADAYLSEGCEEKVIYFTQALASRHGVIMLGETGSGKSVARAVGKYITNSTEKVVNPRAVSWGILLGSYCGNSKQWTDGILASLASAPEYTDSWLVLDGEMTPHWVESLNSVLDETRLLCLASGHRLKLPDKLKLIFEADSLSEVSPATVTRCAVISFGEVPLVSYIVNLMNNMIIPLVPPGMGGYFLQLFQDYFGDAVGFVTSYGRFDIAISKAALVTSTATLLRALLCHSGVEIGIDDLDEQRRFLPATHAKLSVAEYNENVANLCFVYSVMWGVGGGLDDAVAAPFEEFLRTSLARILFADKLESLFSQIPDFTSLRFASLQSKVPIFRPATSLTGLGMLQSIVPTVTLERLLHVTNLLQLEGERVHLHGGCGVGKSTLVQELLRRNTDQSISSHRQGMIATLMLSRGTPCDKILNVFGQFVSHAATMSATVRQSRNDMSQTALQRDKSFVDSAGAGFPQMFLVVEDMNLPSRDSSEPSVSELLRSSLETGGFYTGGKSVEWNMLPYFGVAVTSGRGSVRAVPARLARRFFTISIGQPSEQEMVVVASSLLTGFFQERSFSSEVRSITSPLSQVLVEVLLLSAAAFKVQPARPHLSFSFVQVKSAVQGISLSVPWTCGNVRSVVHLAMHEMTRAFQDRLSSESDRFEFQNILLNAVRRSLPPGSWKSDFFDSEWPAVFTDCLRPDASPEERVYEPVRSPETLPELFEFYCGEMRVAVAEDIVLFKDCCLNLCRIMRALRLTGRLCTLVGVAGCGKKTLTRLSAMMLEYQCFTIQESRSYTVESFRKDLVQLMDTTGLRTQDAVLFLTDAELSVAGIPDELTYIIHHHTVFGLMTSEERAKRVSCLTAEGCEVDVAPHEAWDLFCTQTNTHLHVVLSVTPCNNLLNLLREFPSFVSVATLIWLDLWPHEALALIADRRFRKEKKADSTPADDLMDNSASFRRERSGFILPATSLLGTSILSDGDETPMVFEYKTHQVAHAFRTLSRLPQRCASIHESVVELSASHYSATRQLLPIGPAHFRDLLQAFEGILSERLGCMQVKKDRLNSGLRIMQSTENTVENVQFTLSDSQGLLDEGRRRSCALLQQLAAKELVVKAAKEAVHSKGVAALEGKNRARTIQSSAQQEYDSVIPEMKNAIKAIDSLSRQDIVELRSYNTASKAVAYTSEAVMILLKERKADDWATAKTVFARPDFLERVQGFDRSSVTPEMVVRLHRIINDPDFTPERVGQSGSYACRSICLWARALYRYFHMEQKVAPKREQLAEAEGVYREANEQFELANAELADVTAEVTALEAQREVVEAELGALERNIQLSERHLGTAEEILDILRPHVKRWEAEVNSLEASIECCAKDSLLAAAHVAYLGPFPQAKREALRQKWLGLAGRRETITRSPEKRNSARVSVTWEHDQLGGGGDAQRKLHTPFDFASAAGASDSLIKYALQGIPDDSFTLDNAVMSLQALQPYSKRWPLIVDPHGEVGHWLLKHFRDQQMSVRVIKAPAPDANDEAVAEVASVISEAMSSGVVVIVTQVGKALDTTITRLLLRRYREVPGEQEEAPASYTPLFDGEAGEEACHPNFRLIFSSRLEDLRFTASLWSSLNVIAFTDNQETAEGQVLSDIVGIVQQELENERRKNMQCLAANRSFLVEYEESLIGALQEEEGNLLDSDVIVENLRNIRSTTEQVERQVRSLQKQTSQLTAARKKYSGVARVVCSAYNLTCAFSRISTMYRHGFRCIRDIAADAISAYMEALPEAGLGGSTKSQEGNPAKPTQKSNLRNTPRETPLMREPHQTPTETSLQPPDLPLDVEQLEACVRTKLFSYISWGLQRRHRRGFATAVAAELLLSSGQHTPGDWALFVMDAEEMQQPLRGHRASAGGTRRSQGNKRHRSSGGRGLCVFFAVATESVEAEECAGAEESAAADDSNLAALTTSPSLSISLLGRSAAGPERGLASISASASMPSHPAPAPIPFSLELEDCHGGVRKSIGGASQRTSLWEGSVFGEQSATELPQECWGCLRRLEDSESTGGLVGIVSCVRASPEAWGAWAHTGDASGIKPVTCTSGATPGGTSPRPAHPTPEGRRREEKDGLKHIHPDALTPLQRLLLVKCIAPERCHAAAAVFVAEVLGDEFAAEAPGMSLQEVVSWEHPVVLILRSGADPIPNILGVSQMAGGSKAKVRQLSCGQGQEGSVTSATDTCKRIGDWAIVHNAHLASTELLLSITHGRPARRDDSAKEVVQAPKRSSSVSPAAATEAASRSPSLGHSEAGMNAMMKVGRAIRLLQRSPLIKGMQGSPDKLHVNFRVFMTVPHTAELDPQVVQRCVKVDCGPDGVVPSFQRLFSARSSAADSRADRQEAATLRGIISALCCFHAVLIARGDRRYTGWTCLSVFEDADLSAAVHFAEKMLDASKGEETLNWEAMRGMAADIHYGSRVDDENFRVIDCILSRIFHPEIAAGTKPLHEDTTLPPKHLNGPAYAEAISQLKGLDTTKFLGLGVNADCLEHRHSSASLMGLLLRTTQAAAGTDRGSKLAFDPQAAGPLLMDEANSHHVQATIGRISDMVFAGADAWAEDADDGLPALTLLSLDSIDAKKIARHGPNSTALCQGGLMCDCLASELFCYNTLLTRIHRTLNELLRVICGEAVTDPALEQVFSSLLAGAVPDAWLAVSFPSEELLMPWVSGLCKRLDFFRSWMQKGKMQNYWLAAFYHPNRLYTTIERLHARQMGRAVTDVKIIGEVDAQVTFGASMMQKTTHLEARSRRLSTYVQQGLPSRSMSLGVSQGDQSASPGDSQSTDASASQSVFAFGGVNNESVVLEGLFGDGLEWSAHEQAFIPSTCPGVGLTPLPPIRLRPVLRVFVNECGTVQLPFYQHPGRVVPKCHAGGATFAFSLSLPVSDQYERVLAEAGAAIVAHNIS